MSTTTADDLPSWARHALGMAGALPAGAADADGQPYHRWPYYPEGFAERVAARWLEIERDVLPPLAVLSDTGKGYFFWAMFDQGVIGSGDTPRAARADVQQLDANRVAIADTAAELVQLIDHRRDILDRGLAHDGGIPDLFELIEMAAADCYSWKSAAEQDMRHLLALESTMSRPVPNLVGVLSALACLDPQPTRVDRAAFHGRQASPADYVRLLLGAIDRLPRRSADGLPIDDGQLGGEAARLPADFALPDAALAALVSVLFDLPAGQPSVEAVRASRLAWQRLADDDAEHDAAADQPRDPRPAPAAPAPRPAPTDPAANLLTRRWLH